MEGWGYGGWRGGDITVERLEAFRYPIEVSEIKRALWGGQGQLSEIVERDALWPIQLRVFPTATCCESCAVSKISMMSAVWWILWYDRYVRMSWWAGEGLQGGGGA